MSHAECLPNISHQRLSSFCCLSFLILDSLLICPILYSYYFHYSNFCSFKEDSLMKKTFPHLPSKNSLFPLFLPFPSFLDSLLICRILSILPPCTLLAVYHFRYSQSHVFLCIKNSLLPLFLPFLLPGFSPHRIRSILHSFIRLGLVSPFHSFCSLSFPLFSLFKIFFIFVTPLSDMPSFHSFCCLSFSAFPLHKIIYTLAPSLSQ